MTSHVVVVVLLFASYVLSSTRRLGALVLWSTDMSHLFLNVLVMLINSGEMTERRVRWRRRILRVFHPISCCVFVYFR